MAQQQGSPPYCPCTTGAYRQEVESYAGFLRELGPRGMFYIADHAVSWAYELAKIINDDRIKNVYGEILQDHTAASHWSYALDLLAKLCVGERFLRESEPDILKLNVQMLPLWPGQPLGNFGEAMPVLKASYHYANGARHLCMREMGICSWLVGDDPDLPRALTDGFELLVGKLPTIRSFLPLITDDEFEQSEDALWRLHDLYETAHPMEDLAKHEIDSCRPRALEERILAVFRDCDGPMTTDELANQAHRKKNSHFRTTLSNMVRVRLLTHAPDGGYLLGPKAPMSERKSGPKSGQNQD